MGLNLAILLGSAETPPAELVAALFPRTAYAPTGTGSLASEGFPPRWELSVGSCGRGTLLATRDAALFNPTKLHGRYLKGALGSEVWLLTQQSTYDMFALGRWSEGTLVRSISVNPVGKVWESIGTPEPFELPFWAGKRPAPSGYPLPFHPLEMAEEAFRSVLGVQLEGTADPLLLHADELALETFTRPPR